MTKKKEADKSPVRQPIRVLLRNLSQMRMQCIKGLVTHQVITAEKDILPQVAATRDVYLEFSGNPNKAEHAVKQIFAAMQRVTITRAPRPVDTDLGSAVCIKVESFPSPD